MREQPVVDLGSVQRQLNEDEHVRSRFLKSPVETLEELGLRLPERSKSGLSKAVHEMQAQREPVAGSTLKQAGPQRDVGVEISISKDF